MPKFAKNLWSLLSQQNAQSYKLIERLNLAIAFCEEVKKVHDGNSAHRDIKPSNCMLDNQGHVILIDFGIGRTQGTLDGSSGTAGFLPPEQFACRGQTQKADNFAVGKVLALTIFEWRFGWQLLWSPEFVTQNYIDSLGPLAQIITLIKELTQVRNGYRRRPFLHLKKQKSWKKELIQKTSLCCLK